MSTPSNANFPAHAQTISGPVSAPKVPVKPGSEASQPLYVLYGSNTGTSESFAQRIADSAASYGTYLILSKLDPVMTLVLPGFRASIGTLDSIAGRLPTDGPVIVVCASFEG